MNFYILWPGFILVMAWEQVVGRFHFSYAGGMVKWRGLSDRTFCFPITIITAIKCALSIHKSHLSFSPHGRKTRWQHFGNHVYVFLFRENRMTLFLASRICMTSISFCCIFHSHRLGLTRRENIPLTEYSVNFLSAR